MFVDICGGGGVVGGLLHLRGGELGESWGESEFELGVLGGNLNFDLNLSEL